MSKEKNNPTAVPAPEETQAKKAPNKVLNTIINVILVIAILLAALCTYAAFVSSSGNGVPSLFGVEIFSVQTDSMYPTLKAGDLIISRAVEDMSALRPGDIITYWTVINGERALNTHRIYQIYDGGGYLIFETKGDNNSVVDSLTVHESEVVGKYSSRIAGVGKALDFLQTSTGFLLVVVIPVALFFLYQLVQFFRVLFEYQSVKNRLRFEEEQAARLAAIEKAEAKVAAQQEQQAPVKAQAPPEAAEPVDRESLKAELREQMKAEMMAEMLAELKKQGLVPSEKPAEEAEKPAEEAEKPAEEAEKPAEEAEKPAEEAEKLAEEAEKPAEEAEKPAEEAEKPAEEAEKPAEEAKG